MFIKFLVALCFVCSVYGTTYHSSGASVQLFEWSWSDVANECETYLSKKGFKAVQISPPSEHITGSQWWTRYQPVTYNLVSRSGNEDQFKDMVKRCNAVNVAIIADAVINHMAAGSGTGIAGSTYGSRTYPSYSPQDFHHDANNVNHNCQVNDYYNKTNVQYCDLTGLPDLMTSSDYVQTQIANYINKMASYGVKGIRIDAAKHQDDTEMSGITKRLPSGFYVGQEVIGSTGEAVQPSMYYSTGIVLLAALLKFVRMNSFNIYPQLQDKYRSFTTRTIWIRILSIRIK
jgi:alpha-amylase